MLASFDMHWGYAAGHRADQGINYRPSSHYLPADSVRFDEYVDHLSRIFHGRPADAGLLRAAVRATGVTAGTTITATHQVIRPSFHVRLLVVFLDHPRHMSR
jgi:hypothetical protein